MAKSDKKAMQYRLDGMTYAWDKIKQEGMEAFEKELKARRATFIPLEVDIEKVKEIFAMESFRKFITAFQLEFIRR